MSRHVAILIWWHQCGKCVNWPQFNLLHLIIMKMREMCGEIGLAIVRWLFEQMKIKLLFVVSFIAMYCCWFCLSFIFFWNRIATRSNAKFHSNAINLILSDDITSMATLYLIHLRNIPINTVIILSFVLRHNFP